VLFQEVKGLIVDAEENPGEVAHYVVELDDGGLTPAEQRMLGREVTRHVIAEPNLKPRA
jgi:hypothetical protein